MGCAIKHPAVLRRPGAARRACLKYTPRPRLDRGARSRDNPARAEQCAAGAPKDLSSMKRHTICVFGGTGFVGRHIVRRLAAAGHRVRVPTRHRERNRDLLVLPTVEVIEADIPEPTTLNTLLAGCDTTINLVAVLNDTRRARFRAVHVELPRKIGTAAKQQGVTRLLHMSALNADAQQGASRYLRSKGEGEDVVHGLADDDFDVTSFRPSVIYGPDDHFFNKFAALLKLPGPLPVPCPEAHFAPIFVGDVAQAFVAALHNKATSGQRYDLCGPRAYTMLQLVQYAAKILGRKKTVIGLSNGLSRLQAAVMGRLPGQPITRDNYDSLQVAAVCNGPFPAVFGFAPESIESVVPYYLGQSNQQAFFDAVRQEARHFYFAAGSAATRGRGAGSGAAGRGGAGGAAGRGGTAT